MLLAYKEIRKLIADGTVLNATPELVNGTSLDITLGDKILWEYPHPIKTIIDFRDRDPLTMQIQTIREDGFLFNPGQFMLAQSQQIFHLPNFLSAEFKLKSSAARVGLTNLLAGWCDPGWHGSVLTMELKNETRYHSIRLRPGDRIGQMVFYRHAPVPEEAGYDKRGRYNNDTRVEGIKL